MQCLEMIRLLQEEHIISVYDNINNMGDLIILDVVFLIDDPVSWSDHTLYIGNLSQLESPPDRPIMLLTANRSSLENILPKESFCGIIKSEDTRKVYQLAKDILYEDLKSEAILFKVTQAALHGKNIISLINTAASLIGNALILVDPTMKILAYSTTFDIKDFFWLDSIKRNHCSLEFMQKVRSNKDMQEWSKNGEESRIITLEGDIQPKLVTRITQNGHLIGALVMIVHHTPIKPSHSKQLPQIGKILFETFNSGFRDGTYQSFYSSILFHILSGDELSDTFDPMTMSKLDFPQEMTVVVARFITRIENRYLNRTVGLKLEKIFPKGYLVQFKNYIGILVPSISSKQRNALSELASDEEIYIGISWPFKNILDFRRYFAQAVVSIKQAQSFEETNEVVDYTNYSFYDLLHHCTDKISLQNYCHPALQILKEYDLCNKTQLYITLKTFLNSNRNLGTTGESLFLHRNSVTYRINRIIEVTGLNLNDINTVYSLVDSFRIEAFLEAADIFNS
ncbi:carbohydrate diacid regulator [Clostridium aceticum]|uniref:Carbohydrate diacid regulator n=1 Tax=Clostridium aceticum TaxID=84022 RepID=A0A0D8IAV2_9CLOT|nr:helix-turn-helix domain-containing protein [Clostridium aceticum]AKL96442.1 carbohydrate diacid regulator [Clostridium aceticum]KJF27383.1 hypothetical protein TZ02_08590 [Clostridium aceticum]